MLHVTQSKTGRELQIPILPDLAAILEATPGTNLTFLTAAAGAPFTSNGFGNLFRQWCIEAGLLPVWPRAVCARLAAVG